MKGKYLITADNWFTAPDGQSYVSAWGDVEVMEDSDLGVKTNRNSTNWYCKVGTEENHIIIAGCQIHYAVRCENEPKIVPYEYDETIDGKPKTGKSRTYIFK